MTYLWTGTEWSFPTIEKVYKAIEQIAVEELGLDPYPTQLEIITSEQMVDAYSSIGMPVFYHHWSFGKHFAGQWKMYQGGMMGLAYEIVINSNPCIAYLMEENTMTMQALTIAHAAFGHSHFFKNNAVFREWTDASSIVDYLLFARNYIANCEVREGRQQVESFLDSCHALMNYGVNRYKRPVKLSAIKERERLKAHQDYQQSQVNELFNRLNDPALPESEKKFPAAPEENLLLFCEKFAPELPEWKREILRIVRMVAQYFYPQTQTQICNEGCATYTHYRIMNRLHEKGLMTDGAMLEFLQSHTSVIFQPSFDNPRYRRNPYTFGFAIMCDIERICHNPTAEDRRWFDFAGCGDEMAVLRDGWANYRDESFIRQFLSPKVIRDLKLFQLKDDKKEAMYEVMAIHDDAGYQSIRDILANECERYNVIPQIEVVKMNPKTRVLTLEYQPYQGRALDSVDKMLKHLEQIWGNPVNIYDNKQNHIAGPQN